MNWQGKPILNQRWKTSAEEEQHRQKRSNIGRRGATSAEEEQHRQKRENIGRRGATSAEEGTISAQQQ